MEKGYYKVLKKLKNDQDADKDVSYQLAKFEIKIPYIWVFEIVHSTQL
jgi:hypothetical protein